MQKGYTATFDMDILKCTDWQYLKHQHVKMLVCMATVLCLSPHYTHQAIYFIVYFKNTGHQNPEGYLFRELSYRLNTFRNKLHHSLESVGGTLTFEEILIQG